MKTQFLLAALLFITMLSCNSPRAEHNPKPETPKALEEKNSSLEIVTKRGADDLVAGLYNELAEKTPELKQLEERIANLHESKSDSTASFDHFNEKNLGYYETADIYINQIQDSVLKSNIKNLVAGSLAKYNASVSQHNNILKTIETKELTLNDLHLILKLTRTLPLMEQYQKDNKPSTKSMEGFYKELDGTVRYADTLVKK